MKFLNSRKAFACVLAALLCMLSLHAHAGGLGASNNGAAQVLLLPTAPGSVIDLSSNSTALMLPAGTTAQRPTTANLGELRYNTTTSSVEAYQGTSPAWIALTGGSSVVYPSVGVPYSTGTGWGTSYAVGTAANDLVQLNSSGQLPALSAANLTNFPTLNQSTTGNAATATALATTPTGCLGGQFSTGIAANGNANCSTPSATGTTPVTTIATSGSSQTLVFPSSGNAAYDITLTANCTIALTGGTSGQYQTVTLILRQNSTAGWLPTLPAGVKWSGGISPTPNSTSGQIDVFKLSTSDGGATVFGSY